jgi:hypothetical protein
MRYSGNWDLPGIVLHGSLVPGEDLVNAAERTIRHSIEHGDARAKVVAAYAELGLTFPVASWPEMWAQISAITCGALDALREEVHAGLSTP